MVTTVPRALITGASRGIGRATALRLARSGWEVLAGVRDAGAGEALVREAPGGRLRAIELDVTDAGQIAAAAALIDADGTGTGTGNGTGAGRLDALVNNAGIGLGGPLEILPAEDLRQQFDVNVFGQVAVTRALLPALRRARGRVVFLSSIGGRVSLAFNGPYAASKHAIEAIGDALRVELYRSHVQVALIEPGSVATPIWEKSKQLAQSVIVPPEFEQLYGDIPAKLEGVLADTARRGIAPEVVAETIERALTARRMRARYVVGREARMMVAVRALLPDHVFDRLTRRALKL